MAYLFCFLGISSSDAQAELSTNDRRTYADIINLKFNADPYALDTLTASNAYLIHLGFALNYLLTEDEHLYYKLDDQQDDLIKTIESSEPDEWTNFFLAEIKLQAAFINLKRGNELAAAWQIRQAYKLILKNKETYPDFIFNNKTLGLLHVLIGMIPEQYDWIANLFNMEGEVETGLDELLVVANSNLIFNTEAQIMHAIVSSYLLNDTKIAVSSIEAVKANHPDNQLINYVSIALLLKNADARKALALYEKENYSTQNPLIHYQAGETYLQLGRYLLAEKELLTFLENFKGQNFIKDTYYKLFLAAWLNGNDELAKKYLKKAKTYGQSLTEVDKHANRMINLEDYPNKVIMKIRLFTDGGEYEQATKLIDQTAKESFNTPSNKLEFEYRKARLYHKMDDLKLAIKSYKTVIEVQKDNEYFAPNSCLQLGYIYILQNKRTKAKSYFEKTLEYKKHEYKTSIDNKAKAALKLL